MLSAPKVGNDPREHYLGMLYPSEQHKVYGYATNTRVKFVIVTDNTTSQNRDADMKLVSVNELIPVLGSTVVYTLPVYGCPR